MANVFGLYDNRDPLENASRTGRGIGSFLSRLGSAYGQYKSEQEAKSSDEAKRQKVSAIIQEFNNPNSPEYEGMSQSQRYMKAARLLYQAGEPDMSARFEAEANRIRQEGSRISAEKDIAGIKAKKESEKETAKSQAELEKKTAQEEALKNYEQAYNLWVKEPESVVANTALDRSLNAAKVLKMDLIDPRNMDLRKKSLEASLAQAEAAQGMKQAEIARNEPQREAQQFESDKKKIPNIDSRYSAINEKIDAVRQVINTYKENPKGASYITLKKSLGDAIGGADFAGLMGKDVGSGVLSKFMNAVNASPVTEQEARKWVDAFIQTTQQMVDSFNTEVKSKSKGLKSENELIKSYTIGNIPTLGKAQSQSQFGGSISTSDVSGRKIVTDSKSFFGK